jgi:uncharacterized membrane protein
MDLRSYFLSMVLLFVLDIPWLLYASQFVQPMIYKIQYQQLQLKYAPAVVVYLAMAYLLGLAESPRQAFFIGAATYAVYDFTNLATFKHYDPVFAVADTLWGGILFTLAYYGLHLIMA